MSTSEQREEVEVAKKMAVMRIVQACRDCFVDTGLVILGITFVEGTAEELTVDLDIDGHDGPERFAVRRQPWQSGT